MQYGRIENVITDQNMFWSLKRRMKDTSWKESVQRYVHHFAVKNHRQVQIIQSGAEPALNNSTMHMTLVERGKKRDINAVCIDSRVVQGCLCDSCITPLTQPTLIYDNPASTAGKGVNHARKRVVEFIRRFVQKNGTRGFAFGFDFKSFFKSIPHTRCLHELRKVGIDEPLQRLVMFFIRKYQEQDAARMSDPEERAAEYKRIENGTAIGVTLGSQISQDMALVVPNDVDHTAKDKMRIGEFIRYMDDGLAMADTKERLLALWNKSAEVCKDIGLAFNQAKTHITSLSHGFTFLKCRYFVTESKKIVRKMCRQSIVRIRRHLKKFRAKVNTGEMLLDDVYGSVSSWLGNAKKYFMSYYSRKSITTLYYRLFHGYRLEDKTHDLLQAYRRRLRCGRGAYLAQVSR